MCPIYFRKERNPNTMKITTRSLTQAAVIAAVYAALTLLLAPLSFGQMQIRVSEMLTILPILTPAAVPGLTIGCLISNIAGVSMGATTMYDILFGTVSTFSAAILTRKLRKNPMVAAAPPVILNAVIVGAMLTLVYGLPLWATMGWVGLGQLIACYVLGLPLLWALKKLPQDTFI